MFPFFLESLPEIDNLSSLRKACQGHYSWKVHLSHFSLDHAHGNSNFYLLFVVSSAGMIGFLVLVIGLPYFSKIKHIMLPNFHLLIFDASLREFRTCCTFIVSFCYFGKHHILIGIMYALY